jgi:alpha-L-fucosidase
MKNRFPVAVPLVPLLVLFILACLPSWSRGQATQPAVDPRIQWWRDAKFGMFIHWGPVSVSGKEISWSRVGEWSKKLGNPSTPPEEYDQYYKQFNPVKFDADAWMRLARDAGQKYVVFTAKHHDGFANWATATRDYNIMNTPYGRDICKQLADAAHKYGIRLGWYYSTWDWSHPDYVSGNFAAYDKYYRAQLKELLTNYGKVDVLWFDHISGNWRDWDFQGAFDEVRALQPGILINDRAAKFVGTQEDKPTPEIAALVRGDFSTPERRVGKFDTKRPWETCAPMTDMSTEHSKGGGGWSYRPEGRGRTFKECLTMLVQCVTGDGNLLLNVGPTPEGEIVPENVATLKQMGQWLAKHGDSVYATRGGPYRNGPWGGSTYRDRTVYLHVLKWPADGPLTLPPLPAKVVSAKLLAGSDVAVEQTADGLSVAVPAPQRDEVDTVIAMQIDQSAVEIQPIATTTAPATAKSAAADWKPIFNGKDYAGWYTYVKDGKKNDDPRRIFQVNDGLMHFYKDAKEGEPMPFGYAATEQEFGDCRIRLQYRWGTKRFAPRDKQRRDSGLLYFVTGADQIWPASVECQIQENDVGDAYAIGTTVSATVDPATAKQKQPTYKDGGTEFTTKSDYGRVVRSEMLEKADDWNTVEVELRGDTATHIVNGKVNLRLAKIVTGDPKQSEHRPLSRGRILLQAEGAEVMFRNIEVQPIGK